MGTAINSAHFERTKLNKRTTKKIFWSKRDFCTHLKPIFIWHLKTILWIYNAGSNKAINSHTSAYHLQLFIQHSQHDMDVHVA